ncbi:MAG: IMP cyclohydrolase [Spirochaetales bacterium]|nr:IMP cyclohydrolase [Spirochaetales bacterium]
MKDFRSAYKTILEDFFPKKMEITFSDDNQRQTLSFEKVEWVVEGEKKGLRYGENPDQEAALYRLVDGGLALGGVRCIQPGRWLVSDVELRQSGKHPGKTNLTDVDSGLNILRYLMDRPCAVIIKHNNPCGVAMGSTLFEAYHKAYFADRVAAFGGCVIVNRELDAETATQVLESYVEVVAAPSFAPGVVELFRSKPNIRVLEIPRMDQLGGFVGERVLDMRSLMDGGFVTQWSFVPRARTPGDFFEAQAQYKGQNFQVLRQPNDAEWKDICFGWLVEAGVTSNSVLYVKDGVTVGIGTGEQDRVGVAEIARDKAYRKLADRLSWERWQIPYNNLTDPDQKTEIDTEVQKNRGGLPGSVMVSDAFFPFRDGIDVGLREGVTAVVQPGGSVRDFEVIQACNEAGAAMVFTGQRSFRH